MCNHHSKLIHVVNPTFGDDVTHWWQYWGWFMDYWVDHIGPNKMRVSTKIDCFTRDSQRCWMLTHSLFLLLNVPCLLIPFPKITCWKEFRKVWKWISTLPHSDGRSWVLACHPPNMLQRWFWSVKSSLNLIFQIYQRYKAHMFTSFVRCLFRSIRTELLLRWIAGCLMV